MSRLIARFRSDKAAATAIEYGLIAALIALAIMVGAGTIGNALKNTFSKVGTKINTANTNNP